MNEIQKFRGVSRHKEGGFVAYLAGRYLGLHRTFDAAKAARIAAEVDAYGAPLERREIEVLGDVARVPLHGRGNVFHGWALIDADDLPVVRPISWTRDPRGYVAGRPAGFENNVTLHRWLMLRGAKGAASVDHISGDRTDNRKANLRLCTQAENSRNTRLGRNNTSGAKGVSLTAAGTWRARIWLDRQEIHIGAFATVEEARAAYDRAAIVLHGEFASTNASAGTCQSCGAALAIGRRFCDAECIWTFKDGTTPGVRVLVTPIPTEA